MPLPRGFTKYVTTRLAWRFGDLVNVHHIDTCSLEGWDHLIDHPYAQELIEFINQGGSVATLGKQLASPKRTPALLGALPYMFLCFNRVI